MKPVFVDTFFFIAYLNRLDRNHDQAVMVSRQIRSQMVITMAVLTEVVDAFAASTCRRRMAGFIASLENDPNIRIIPWSPPLFQKRLDLFDSRPDKEWSLTDCISFVVMNDEGITDVFTGDRHFEQAEFNRLLK